MDDGSVPKSGIELTRASSLRRIWIVAVDVELSALVLTDLAPGIDGILLLIEMATATSHAVLLDVPTTVGVGHYMM